MLSFSNPLAQFLAHEEEINQAIQEVLHGNSYILGKNSKEFEVNFAKFCNVKFAVGVGSGTEAISISLKALGIGVGDEVITVSHTALATVAGIISAGATPVLIDIDPDYFTLSPDLLKNAISKKTKAIIPVHLYGQPALMDEISAFANNHGLYVIEDCAQAVGAAYGNHKVGSIGNLGCFSFYPTKNLGAIGDGGMITTNSESLYEKISKIRQYGWNENRETNEPGINSRLDEIQAAILNVKLKYLDADNRSRQTVALSYDSLIKESKIYKKQKSLQNTQHVYHLYVIQCSNREQLLSLFNKNQIFPGIHYKNPAHKHGGYKQLCRIPKLGLPVTDALVNNIISLPIYPEIKTSEVQNVISILKSFENE